VSIDENIPAIVVLWKGYATGTQLRFVHENILDQLRKHGMSKVLGDDTGLPTIHAEDQSWIVENWMPRAIAAGRSRPAFRFVFRQPVDWQDPVGGPSWFGSPLVRRHRRGPEGG